jgi:hypothetical protein
MESAEFPLIAEDTTSINTATISSNRVQITPLKEESYCAISSPSFQLFKKEERRRRN